MRTLREKLTWLERWFRKFDRRHFNSYFADKKSVKIKFNSRLRTTYAVAYADGIIEINPRMFNEWSYEEIRDTLLHEMLHLFLHYTHRDKNAWNHHSPQFREWSKRLNCPVMGLGYLISKKEVIFRICFDCDEYFFLASRETRRRRCVFCGSLNTKLYRRTPNL